MTDTKQPDALRLATCLQDHVVTYPQLSEDEPGGYCGEVDRVMDESAAELRRLHAENEALASKLKVYEDLDEADSDVQLLRMGYAAARLEIESLNARIKGLISERDAAYEVAMMNAKPWAAWAEAAQAAPAAVAGPSVKYVPVESGLRDANWRHPNDDEPRTQECLAALREREDDEGQGLDGFWKWGFAAGFNAALAAAPTTQAAPQQEPVAWRHSKTLRLYETKAEVPLAGGDEWAEPLCLAAQHPAPVAQGDAAQPRLTVRLTSSPESNGKRNWTAMFVRAEKFGGLVGNAGGITIERGELWNRVAYAAECARFLIGERDTEPCIFDYGNDIQTPDEWQGETRRAARAQAKEGQSHD